MPLLTRREAFDVTDAFLCTLYGEDMFLRWKCLKTEMQFSSERDYVRWLMDMAMAGGTSEPVATGGKTFIPEHSAPSNASGSCGEGNGYSTSNNEQSRDFVKMETSDVVIIPDTCERSFKAGPGPVKRMRYPSTSDCWVESDLQGMSGQEEEGFGYQEEAPAPLQDDGEDIFLTGGCAGGGGSSAVTPYVPQATDKGGQSNEDEASMFEKMMTSLESSVLNADQMAPSDLASGKKFGCPDCSYMSDVKRNVTMHIAAKHMRLKPFTCQYCDYSCARKHHLEYHLIRKHGYSSHHMCPNCQKPFAMAKQLESHLLLCVGVSNTSENT